MHLPKPWTSPSSKNPLSLTPLQKWCWKILSISSSTITNMSEMPNFLKTRDPV